MLLWPPGLSQFRFELAYTANRKQNESKRPARGLRPVLGEISQNPAKPFGLFEKAAVASDGRQRRDEMLNQNLQWLIQHLQRLNQKVKCMSGSGTDSTKAHTDLVGPVIILVEPQLGENIGMCARAMGNFGLTRLRIVNPRDGWPNEKARIAASGANYIIDDARAYDTLEASIGDLNWLAATTARQRDLRKPVMTPEQAIAEMRTRIARGERCGILFGRERNGLETSEVANADALIMIPVNSRFASLNLAQAVLLLGYEWMRGDPGRSLGRVTTFERPLSEGLYLGRDRLATKEELLGFFEHLERELEAQGFFNPEHRRPTVVQNLRSLLSRIGATDQEVRTLRGIVATLAQGKGAARKPRS
jgi:tRNA/rRNA methyltransferase